MLLLDAHGKPVVPLTPLPGINFGAHLEAERSRRQQVKEEEPAATEKQAKQEEGSYFPPQSSSNEARQEEVEAPFSTQDPDSDGNSDIVPNAELKRTRTAPTPATRTASGRRLNTFIYGKRNNSRDPYFYTFDPMFTDSDSNSDDEDEAQTLKARRAAKGSVDSHNKEDQRRRRDERKGCSYSRFQIGNENFRSKGRVSKRDGRLNISINETANTGYIAKALGHSLRNHLDLPNARNPQKQRRYEADHSDPARSRSDAQPDNASQLDASLPIPHLNIVIIVIGSRGDIQPFIRIGQILKREHGHRVRLATHATFRDFVEESGLEFFSVGGDPSELMAFMVKNPGLIPSLSTLREGEVHRRRVAMGEMFEGMWRACTNIKDGETDPKNLALMTQEHPFIADAVIANPPSMAPPHIVERLGIPLFMAFTFPYSPTQQFPHPLANIRSGRSNVDANYVNFMSYPLVEMMTWQGLGDVVNRFRMRTLHLEPVSSLWAPGALYRMKVPYTYMWSPSLVPKPSDWGPEIDVTGFVFLELAADFKPPKDLVDFLDAGPPPVYIGFGSIVVDDPDKFTQMIFDAVKIAGVRALVNKGWGGLGGRAGSKIPENIYMLGNTPHDWLFPRVSAVVHHGGAGTTAIGLKCARPTMIVPFFGDQPFWGAEVAKHKAGAHECIPYKKLNAERLAEGIRQCLTDEAKTNAKKLADAIIAEGDGAANAVRSFHRSLPLKGRHSIRCSILPERVAVWQLRGYAVQLSSLAAEVLLQKGKIRRHDLKLIRHHSWNDFDGPGEPITGTVGALTDSVYGIGTGVGMVPVRIAKHIRKRQEHEQKKRAVAQKKEQHRRKKEAARGHAANEGAANGDHPDRPAAERTITATTLDSNLSADPAEPLTTQVAGEVGLGLKKSGWALLTMPAQLHLAVAQGFHNAPRLWGDATVRKPTRITGIKSGLVAARRELGYGVYDGFTGVVKQPIGGWRDGATVRGKFSGLGTGIAKGLGGLVIKNVSAIVAPPAYIGKGVLVFIEKKAEGEGSKKLIRRSQFTQGLINLLDLRNKAAKSDADRAALSDILTRVSDGWRVYEELSSALHEHFFGHSGRGLTDVTARVKFQRDHSRWVRSGALSSVTDAREALEVHRAGGDLKAYLARRERELLEMERPRTPALKTRASTSAGTNGEEKGKVDETDTENGDYHGDEGHSETAAVQDRRVLSNGKPIKRTLGTEPAKVNMEKSRKTESPSPGPPSTNIPSAPGSPVPGLALINEEDSSTNSAATTVVATPEEEPAKPSRLSMFSLPSPRLDRFSSKRSTASTPAGKNRGASTTTASRKRHRNTVGNDQRVRMRAGGVAGAVTLAGIKARPPIARMATA